MSDILFLYKSSAKKWGWFRLITGFLFGVVLGCALYIYPTPPFNEPPKFLSWMPTFIGLLFIVGGAWEMYRGIVMLNKNGKWHIEINDNELIYHTPDASRENSFSIALHDIESVTVEYPDANSESDGIQYITSKDEKKYYFGNSENLFNVDKVINILRKKGIEIHTIPMIQ